MHAAFLRDSSMQVKVGNALLKTLRVTGGGAVQGSVLGVMDHNAVMENIDLDFLSESHKYVDDLTTTKTIAHTASGYEHQELGGTLTDIFHAAMSELNLHTLANYCEKMGLKVNEGETQLVAVSSNKRPTT